MNERTIAALKKMLAAANAAMARYLLAEKARLPDVNNKELAARVALSNLAACIETEGVL